MSTLETSGKLFGAIEAGGTKFNCVVGRSPLEALECASFPTTTPEETLSRSLAFFRGASEKYGEMAALGIGSFGPVELNPKSALYGSILTTPKSGWSNCKVRDYFYESLNIPVAFETDVNAAAYGEFYYGAAKGVDSFVYVTIGTGVGAGVISKGKIYQGAAHPEAGHMLMPRDVNRDPFEGCCPFHGDCLEGLAAGPAIEARWGVKASELEPGHEAWPLEAYYLAVMCVNLVNVYGPQKIILGGGVMKQSHLFPLIRAEFKRLMNGYSSLEALSNLNEFIVPPALDGRSGEVGSLILAQESLAP